MARIEIDPNYSSPTFSRATAGTDLFKKEDVQALAAAVSTHDHTTGKGAVLAAGSIPAGSITSGMIADGTIVAGDIADGAVTSAKILDGTIATGDLANDAVTQRAGTTLNSDVSTTSTSFIDVVASSTTLTTVGGDILILYSGPLSVAGGSVAQLLVNQDGVDSAVLVSSFSATTIPATFMYRYIAPAAGSHTYKLRVRSSTGGAVAISYAGAAAGSFIVLELKR